MDVALVVSSFLPRFGGVEEHTLNVARGLARERNVTEPSTARHCCVPRYGARPAGRAR